MRIEVACEIAAPPDAVFAALGDIPGWPDMLPAVRSIRIITPGPVSVGTRFRETRLMHGREASEDMTVAVLDPPKRLVLTAESNGARYTVDHVLVPAGSGTRLSLTFEGRPITLLARLLAPLASVARGAVERQLTDDLAHLAMAVEKRATPMS